MAACKGGVIRRGNPVGAANKIYLSRGNILKNHFKAIAQCHSRYKLLVRPAEFEPSVYGFEDRSPPRALTTHKYNTYILMLCNTISICSDFGRAVLVVCIS